MTCSENILTENIIFLLISFKQKTKRFQCKMMSPARLELATLRVLGGRDNYYTTETKVKNVEHYTIFEIKSIKFSIPTKR